MGRGLMRGVVAATVMLGLGARSAQAADADAAELGSLESHESIRQAIETTQQTDPELAAEMERQLELMESGELRIEAGPPPVESDDVTISSTEFLGVPGTEDSTLAQVQSDPRMEGIRQQFESGSITEDQAREQLFEVLRDHGIEPADGREWESLRDHEEGLEHAYERMSPEAREQMERLFQYEHESEYRETDQEFEPLAHEGSLPISESRTPEYEMPPPPEYQGDMPPPPQ